MSKAPAPGTVFWITGLSGAGKTTVGQLLAERRRDAGRSLVYLDGDILREVFARRDEYTLEERRSLASTYGRMCRMLAAQGHDVVCATVSMFDDVRAWNRGHIERYREIYLRVPMDVLRARDRKGLYGGGQARNVMGVDMPVDEPKYPDLVIDNDGRSSPAEVVQQILDRFDGAS